MRAVLYILTTFCAFVQICEQYIGETLAVDTASEAMQVRPLFDSLILHMSVFLVYSMSIHHINL